jgi:DNA-binding response OmpR family regulator
MPNILIVDDSPAILTVIASALEDKGYQVTTASSGEVAIETLSIKDFDLVITDLNMHETDGIAVLKKAKELNPVCGVMILTGNRDRAFAIEALRVGADDYMLKPCNLSELWERVAKCLERSELRLRHGRPEWRVPHQATSSEHKEVQL